MPRPFASIGYARFCTSALEAVNRQGRVWRLNRVRLDVDAADLVLARACQIPTTRWRRSSLPKSESGRGARKSIMSDPLSFQLSRALRRAQHSFQQDEKGRIARKRPSARRPFASRWLLPHPRQPFSVVEPAIDGSDHVRLRGDPAWKECLEKLVAIDGPVRRRSRARAAGGAPSAARPACGAPSRARGSPTSGARTGCRPLTRLRSPRPASNTVNATPVSTECCGPRECPSALRTDELASSVLRRLRRLCAPIASHRSSSLRGCQPISIRQ
jgi:hypothetical protein